jgi:LysM repeat protein
VRCLVAVVCAALLTGCSGSGHRASRDAPTSSSVAPSSTVPPTTVPPITTYVVKQGDTLSAIARQFHVSVAAIESENHLANPDLLTLGAALRIPHAPPVNLAVEPAIGPHGRVFEIHLTGAIPAEQITFEVDTPKGQYSGAPHVAGDDGSVTTTYQTATTDPTGPYSVTAHGSEGTQAKNTFFVTAS